MFWVYLRVFAVYQRQCFEFTWVSVQSLPWSVLSFFRQCFESVWVYLRQCLEFSWVSVLVYLRQCLEFSWVSVLVYLRQCFEFTGGLSLPETVFWVYRRFEFTWDSVLSSPLWSELTLSLLSQTSPPPHYRMDARMALTPISALVWQGSDIFSCVERNAVTFSSVLVWFTCKTDISVQW